MRKYIIKSNTKKTINKWELIRKVEIMGKMRKIMENKGNIMGKIMFWNLLRKKTKYYIILNSPKNIKYNSKKRISKINIIYLQK
jgi:hypothetical protein